VKEKGHSERENSDNFSQPDWLRGRKISNKMEKRRNQKVEAKTQVAEGKGDRADPKSAPSSELTDKSE